MSRSSPFPSFSLGEAVILAKTINENNGGNPMRRLTLFDFLKRSPDSGPSRSLVTASSGYGLTIGGYSAEEIILTERGKSVVEKNAQAQLDAVLSIEIFKTFFDKYKNTTLPLEKAGIDFLVKQGIDEKNANTCLKVIMANGEQVFLIQEISGTKKVVSQEHAYEKLIKVDLNNQTLINDKETFKREEIKPSIAESIGSLDGPTMSQDTFSPKLHIDIQIHISADAKNEQIDQIFASMAKHLYGRN